MKNMLPIFYRKYEFRVCSAINQMLKWRQVLEKAKQAQYEEVNALLIDFEKAQDSFQ